METYAEKFRFDWHNLPAITAHLPGTGGDTRASIEDFAVSEVPSYLPSGEGTHAYALVEKRGLTTLDLVAALKREGVPERDVGYAGQKDKYAVTRQWISVPEKFASRLDSLDELDGVRVLRRSCHRNKLDLGHLRANQFEVRVRQPDSDWRAKAREIIAHLGGIGLPNYFGPQRFGHFNSNAMDALRVIRGERVPGNRRMQRFYFSALQSQLFNWMLKVRIERGLYAHVLSGDHAQKHDTGGMFVVEDGTLETPRAQRLEISAALPMYGKKVKVSTGEAGELEREILDEFGLDWDCFRGVHGSRRISRVRLDEISLDATEDGYVARFSLPKGAFATCLLRELTKTYDEIRSGS